jgi:hypothetical protein
VLSFRVDFVSAQSFAVVLHPEPADCSRLADCSVQVFHWGIAAGHLSGTL